MLYQSKKPHGGDRYGRPVELDFSANTNPLGTPTSVTEAVVESAAYLNQYPDPYCRKLVAALADFEGLKRETILCGSGAAELIFSFCAALRPRRALELAPTFSEYAAALASVGCAVSRYPLSAENGFQLTEQFLNELYQSDCEVLFLCNPNNPTGRTIDPALLDSVRSLCQKKGIWLFLDECFLDLSDGGRGLSLKNWLDQNPRLFLLKAFTKSYGMAGLRLGYCLSGNPELLAEMGRSVQPWNVSLPAQAAGVAALGERDFLVRTTAIICQERAWLRSRLEELGLWVCPSQANYLLLRSPRELYEPLLERGILIRDCSNYHGLGRGWYRVAVKLRDENQRLTSALGGRLGG